MENKDINSNPLHISSVKLKWKIALTIKSFAQMSWDSRLKIR